MRHPAAAEREQRLRARELVAGATPRLLVSGEERPLVQQVGAGERIVCLRERFLPATLSAESLHLRSFSISGQERVFRICPFVSHARRAWATPKST